MLVCVALAGCGGAAETKTTTNWVTLTESRTVIETVTAHQRASTITKTASPPGAAPAPSAANAFSGSGQKSVGTINVPHDSTLTWTCSGECSTFAIANAPSDPNQIALDTSGQHGGTTAVSAGTYHQVQVISGGDWTFRIG
jgi:hypothetical protein